LPEVCRDFGGKSEKAASRDARFWDFLSLWRKSTRKPEETGIKAVIARKTAARWEQ
jgi:hypothetical protein